MKIMRRALLAAMLIAVGLAGSMQSSTAAPWGCDYVGPTAFWVSGSVSAGQQSAGSNGDTTICVSPITEPELEACTLHSIVDMDFTGSMPSGPQTCTSVGYPTPAKNVTDPVSDSRVCQNAEMSKNCVQPD